MVRSRKLGPDVPVLQGITAVGGAMNRVRDLLMRQRVELLGRWDRQLRAAASAGFGLDSGTAEVLPHLLDALDRALERRFRTVPAGAPAIPAGAPPPAAPASLLAR